MVVQGSYAGKRLTMSLKPGSLSVLRGSDEVLTYDRAGRLWLALREGVSARRGLDGKLLIKRPASGERTRQTAEAAAGLVDECAARMQELLAAVDAGVIEWEQAPPAELREVLARAAAFDAQAATTSAAEYHRIYDPVGILPPDQYIALVLQATIGCSFNSCTFCDFYRGRRFRVRSEDEFAEHARAVHSFIGDALPMRRSIFLGEANALTTPMPRLTRLLEIARAEFGDLPIHAFQDGFSGPRKSVNDYRWLGRLGLRRVSIGMESGHDPLLQFVRKPGNSSEIEDTVVHLKQAGIAVNLIILMGLGGADYAEAHITDTQTLLARLPLDNDDIIYLSDLQPQPESDYPLQIETAGIRPLSADEIQAQREALAITLRRKRTGPRVARYDIGEFVY